MIVVTSNAYIKDQLMNKRYSYHKNGNTGENVSPDIEWSDTPSGTKSVAITIFDPDAKSKNGWWHWVLFNIPRSVFELRAGISNTPEMPNGAIESLNDYGELGYGGPCPPVGDGPHRYQITVYALKDKINLGPYDKPEEVNSQIQNLMLDSGTLISLYKR